MSTQMPNYSIKIAETDEVEHGFYSLSTGIFYSIGPLSQTLNWLYSEADKMIVEKDIRLSNDPFLEVKFSSRTRYSEYTICVSVINELLKTFDLQEQKMIDTLEYVIVYDDGQQFEVEKASESSSFATDTSLVFKNMSLNSIFKILRRCEGTNIIVEHRASNVNLELQEGESKLDIEIPISTLIDPLELCNLFEQLGFTTDLEFRAIEQFSISDSSYTD